MNEGLHSVLRGRLNGLARLAKGYSKTDGMLALSIELARMILGWDLAAMHVLRIPQ